MSLEERASMQATANCVCTTCVQYRQIYRILLIDPAEHATTSRDYGRGFAEAIRQVREILGAER